MDFMTFFPVCVVIWEIKLLAVGSGFNLSEETSEQYFDYEIIEIYYSYFPSPQKGNLCPSILLSAVLDFLYALWKGRRETALSVLREKFVISVIERKFHMCSNLPFREEFWPSICLSLTRNLEEPGGSDVSHDLQVWLIYVALDW